MKLSDFLFNVGRPVAFYPGLVKALGSMKQAVFVCQMAYWKDKGEDPDGWIYKTSDEIETETSLTYKEQIVVRAALVEKKALEERYARTEHLMYFRVNWDVVNTIWEEHLTNGHMPSGKVAPDQRSTGILPKVSSLNSNTETTQKTTQGKTKVSKETQEAILKLGGIGWMVTAGEQVDQSVIDDAVLANDARNTFEKVFGFGTLPWSSNDVWTKFEKLVVQAYKENPGWIAQYVLWRNGDGKYSAFSNRKIRENPQMFMDTGYPEFAASKAYQKLTQQQQPSEPKPLVTPFTENIDTWVPYERPTFDQIISQKKSSSEPLSE
jgi:hypothetical protein